jgi:hypothetical protein
MSDHDTSFDAQPEAPGGRMSLWAGVIGAPLVWGLDLQVRYALVPWACRGGHLTTVNLLSFAFLALTVLAVTLCWREWRRVGVDVPDGSEGGAVARTQFLAGLGILVSGFFSLVILCQALPGFFLNPCIE